MNRRNLLKSIGAACGALLSGISLTQAKPIAELQLPKEEWTHPAHWDYVYNCPRCGERCDNDHNCIASTTPYACGYNGEYEWDETIQCSCGETWEVEDAGT